MLGKKITKSAASQIQSVVLEQDEYLDMDLSHLMQYADLQLEEQGTLKQAEKFQDEE